jgi:hypothetical protein
MNNQDILVGSLMLLGLAALYCTIRWLRGDGIESETHEGTGAEAAEMLAKERFGRALHEIVEQADRDRLDARQAEARRKG